MLLYQVVNRGNGQATANADGDITLVSGWQGDVIPTAANQTIVVPVARRKDGSPVTGRVIARLFDLPDGAHSAPIRLASLGTAQPYPPADLAQPDATLDVAQQRGLRRAPGRETHGAARRLGVRQL